MIRLTNSSNTKKKSNPRKNAHFLSILTFMYTLPTFIRGFKKKFSAEDIYETLPEHEANRLGQLAKKLWSEEVREASKKGEEPSLLKILKKLFGWQLFYLTLIVTVKEVLILMCFPVALGKMISVYSVNNSDVITYAAYLIASSFLSFILTHPFSMEMENIDLKIKIVCSTLIYQKILKLNKSTLRQTSPGQIINLLSSDVYTFYRFPDSVACILVAPLQAVVIFYLTYKNVGIPGILGLCLPFCFIPIQFYFGRRVAKYHPKTLIRRDERLKLTNELVQGIDIIKMYVWEKQFEKLISLYRKQEIDAVKQTILSKGIFHFFTIFISTSLFIIVVISSLFSIPISATSVFTTAVLFNTCCMTFMIILPNSILMFEQIKISVRRITTFLICEEIQLSVTRNCAEYAVRVINATANWKEMENENVFTNLTVNFNFGCITAVIGPVGCGKSSLLHMILQELPLKQGQLSVGGTLSYASQDSWIFSGTVQENILLGCKMSSKRYEDVVRCCGLEKDLSLLPYGDNTRVGENGTALSGGQKARITLARAIYRDADVYLLDDPLSAVDTQVGKQIFDDCICTFLKHKTVVLVTHQLQYLKYVDHIVVLEEGGLKTQGSPIELQKSGFGFAQYLIRQDSDVQNIYVKRENETIATNKINSEIKNEQDNPFTSKSVFTTYKHYVQACGSNWLVILTVFSFLGTQFFTSLSFYFIFYWFKLKKDLSSDSYENGLTMYIYMYCGVCLATIAFSVLRIISYVNLAMRSSIALHQSMLSNLIRASVSFFRLHQSGGILNRFSKDLRTIDDVLTSCSITTIRIILNAIGILTVICLVSSWFIIPTVLVVVSFFWTRNVYLATNLNVLRQEGISRSPIYGHANASLQGLTTIRAFGVQEIWIRHFNRLLDQQSSLQYLSMSLAKALSFWTDGICFLYTVFIVVYFIVNENSTGEGIGLAICQIVQLTGQLAFGIQQVTDFENCMVSVERILEYTFIQPERSLKNSIECNPSPSWPERGLIKFANVSLRYAKTEPYVLKNLNFVINPQERIGIAGRTGAGKSSTISALFQLFETEGVITIDGIDIQTISLNNLRNKISIIPQDPVIFSGTIRQNLDPLNEYNDEVLWKALDEVSLKRKIDKLGTGLNSEISQNGANLSVGQRQLICLARAIIRNNKILILDEATANIDLQTDDLIQEIITKKFSSCTILIVAHRLKTIMDSDKILVMDDGKVVEYDHPHILLQNRNSKLYSLVQETEQAMANILINIAKESYNKKVMQDQSFA